jgi:transcriptional regulator with XRE-family HTH domain
MQLDLALEAGVSARHVSFVETGRSRPSAEMVVQLAEHLDVPLRDRNALLLAAGYAPAYAQHDLEEPEMGPIHDAIDRLLRGHEPFPALVVDRQWGLVAANRAVPLLIAGAAEHLTAPPVNVLRFSLHPEGMAPRIVNLGEWRAHLLDRLGRQAVVSGDPALFALHEELAGYPGGDHAPSPDLEAGAIGGADAPARRRRGARVHQHSDDVRDGHRRHGVRARDRVVLPRRRGDGRRARAAHAHQIVAPAIFCATLRRDVTGTHSG